MRPRPLGAYVRLAAAMAIVGSSVVAGKLVIRTFPVFLASGLRFALACLLLVPLLIRQEKGFPAIAGKDLALMFVQSLAGTFLFSIFLLYGLKYTTAAESGVITSTTPAVVGLIAFLFLKERLTAAKGLALVLAVLGIMALNLGGHKAGARGQNPWLGNALVFGAVLGEALFITIGKAVSGRVSPLAISTVVSIVGLVLFLPPAVYEAWHFDFGRPAFYDWLTIIYFGVVVTVVAFILWYSGLARVQASTAAVFTGVLPVSAVLLSYLVLAELFLWSHLIGLAFVLAAIGLVARAGPEE